MHLRKLSSKEVLERKKRRNQLIVGLILVAIMILSTAGYAIEREKSESFSYNGFEFTSAQIGWQIINQPFNLVTRFLPQDVENISLAGYWSADDFAGQEVYFIAYTEEEKIAASEIARNLQFKRAQYACLEEDADLAVCQDLPIKTCSDAVISINQASYKDKADNETASLQEAGQEEAGIEARIYKKDSCIMIEAEYNDLIKSADRFLFAVYKVI